MKIIILFFATFALGGILYGNALGDSLPYFNQANPLNETAAQSSLTVSGHGEASGRTKAEAVKKAEAQAKAHMLSDSAMRKLGLSKHETVRVRKTDKKVLAVVSIVWSPARR